MFCTGCGTPVHPHDHFCHHCGKELQMTEGGRPPSRKKTAPWVILTGVVFLFLSFYFIWAMLSYNDLQTPVEAQLKALRENKVPEAYYEYTSHSFQTATSLDQFKQFITANEVLQDNQNISFQQPIVADDKGLLIGVVETTDGEKIPIQFILEREDNAWKVMNIELSAVLDVEKQIETSEDDQALFAPINNQLMHLKEGRKDEAYEGVASGFKKVTSRSQFDAFVDRFPAIKNYSSIAFKEKKVEGDRAVVRVDLLNKDKIIPLEYHLMKEDGQWKIWSLQLLQLTKEMPKASLMLVPIQNQMKELKEGKIEEAYQLNVSEQFKKVTSLDAFKAFLQKYPVLTNYASIDYQQPTLEEGGGKVIVILTGIDGSKTTLEYTMGVENGIWKIWGFKLNQEVNTSHSFLSESTDLFNQEILAKVVNGQLKQIQSGNNQKAYQDFTSVEFQEATSPEQFNTFLENYKFFKKGGKFIPIEVSLNNNIATLKGYFKDLEQGKVPVEYDFVLDSSDKWKVLRIQVISTDESSAADFPKIVIGNETDKDGVVLDEKDIITQKGKTIFANIYVKGKKGEIVSVVFRHLDSNSAIPAVSSSPLPSDGTYRTSFSFTPPPQGWPEGNYVLEITTSEGKSTTYSFQLQWF